MPRKPHSEEHREEEKEIAVRKGLDQPRAGEKPQPAATPPVQVRVRRRDSERHAERPEDLDVRQL